MSVVLKTPSNGSITLAEQDTASNVTVTIPATTGNAVVSTPDLAYSPYTGFRNRIINGGMVIDQRNGGAEINPAVNGFYYLDRWYAVSTTASKFKIGQNAGSVTPPLGFTKYLGVTSLSAYSVGAADFFLIKQLIEGNNVADLDWGTANAQGVSVSFWVRSSLTGNFGLILAWGSSSATQRSYPILYSISVANTWEYKTITIPGDTTMAAGGFETGIGAGIQIRFSLGGGATNAGTSGAWATKNAQTVTGDTSVVGTSGATFYITGVQLEKGSTATPFEFRSIGQELALCQRYYETGFARIQTYAVATNNQVGWCSFAVSKRTAPTMTQAFSGSNSSSFGTTTININGFAPFSTAAETGQLSCGGSWTASSEL